jgi:MoaA/NifB/PqqE/SkfB family radical SAM enzyme
MVPLPNPVVEQELSTEQVLDRLIPQCEQLGVRVFALTGGEVMLRRDIAQIFGRLGSSAMDWCIDSNLSRCTPELAEGIVAADCETVFVSIDGQEAVHNALRASRFAFQQATRGIRNLIEARFRTGTRRPRVVLNCVLQPGNEGSLGDVVQIAHEHKADGVAFQLLSKLGYEAVQFDARAAVEGLRAARLLARDAKIDMSIFPLRDPSAEQLGRWFEPAPSAGFFSDCSYVESSLRIDPGGNVIPCVENSVGNILSEDLRAIWEGPAYQLFRDRIHSQPLRACHRCCNMTT